MRCLLTIGLLFACSAQGQVLELGGGRASAQYLLTSYPPDSLFRELLDTPAHDFNGQLRVLVGGGADRWRWQADYQLVARYGDTVPLGRELVGTALNPNTIINDDRRLMNLSHNITEGDDGVLLHRLDRLHVGYTGDKTVVRLGRQAVSWGNGLIYNPVDFFNPFDPAAVDQEFKTGDDMLYGQFLQDSGNDWQLVSVWRRDNQDRNREQKQGEPDPDVNTHAVKYHRFIGEQEIDLLLARHYTDTVVSLGGVSSWGGAIVRGDLMITQTDRDTYTSLVANLSYAWTAWDRNTSAVIEYFFNDFGLSKRHYPDLIQYPDLLQRLNRGELFTLGRQYLAAGLSIETSPLTLLSPSLFLNLEDASGLLQVIGQYDFREDWQLRASLALPFGPSDSEFGGFESPVPGKEISNGPAFVAQLAFYF